MDREAWWDTVHGVAKSRTRLSLTHTHTHTHRGPPCSVFREGKDSQGSEWGGTLRVLFWLAYAGSGAELFHSNLSVDSQKDPGRYCPQILLQLEKLRLRASSGMAGGTQLRSGRPEAGGTFVLLEQASLVASIPCSPRPALCISSACVFR